MVNWTKILDSGYGVEVRDFANGKLSGRQLRERVSFTPVAGEVRKALLENGVDKARRLARRALERAS